MQILRLWLTSNAPILAGRTLEQIAEIAIACGHDRLIVKQWLNSQRFHNLEVA